MRWVECKYINCRWISSGGIFKHFLRDQQSKKFQNSCQLQLQTNFSPFQENFIKLGESLRWPSFLHPKMSAPQNPFSQLKLIRVSFRARTKRNKKKEFFFSLMNPPSFHRKQRVPLNEEPWGWIPCIVLKTCIKYLYIRKGNGAALEHLKCKWVSWKGKNGRNHWCMCLKWKWLCTREKFLLEI